MELSTEAREISDVTCNYENLVSMATEIYRHRFAVDSIQTLYLEHMFPEQLRTNFVILTFEG